MGIYSLCNNSLPMASCTHCSQPLFFLFSFSFLFFCILGAETCSKLFIKLFFFFLDHVYFVHPSTDISVVISTDTRPIYRSTYRPSVDRYVGRHIGRVSVDMSTETCRSSTDVSVDMSTDTRPICWSICRLRVVVRLSVDMAIDRLPTFRRYFKKGYCQLAKILPICMPV